MLDGTRNNTYKGSHLVSLCIGLPTCAVRGCNSFLVEDIRGGEVLTVFRKAVYFALIFSL